MAQRWKVTGGVSTGGLLVREGKKLTSSALDARLATGARLEELELDGERLSFKKLEGEGPERGWISIKAKGQDIVVRDGLVPPAPGTLRRAIADGDEAAALELLGAPRGEAAAQANALGPPPARRSALHEAAEKGLREVCSALLGTTTTARITDPNLRDGLGKTALLNPAYLGHLAVCQLLLDHERFTAVSVADNTGATALHCAAYGGHRDICRLLLDHEAFTAADAQCNGSNALHLACTLGHVEVCKLLLEHPRFGEAAVNAPGGDGCTALILAALNDKVEVAKAILACDRFTAVNGVNHNGCHALGSAAWGCSPGVVQLMLDCSRFTVVNAQTNQGWIAAHEAVIKRGGTLKLILDHPRFEAHNVQDNTGATALHLAADFGHAEECQQLLDHPSFTAVNVLTEERRSALHNAAFHGHVEACKVFLNHPRVEVEQVGMGGCTVLHAAAYSGEGKPGEVVKAILDHPRFGLPEFQSDDGSTALHLAAKHNRPEACRALLQHLRFGGAKLAALKDRRGKDAFSAAQPMSEAWSVLEELLTED